MTFWQKIDTAVKRAVKRAQGMTEAELRADWKLKQQQRGNPFCPTLREIRRIFGLKE